MPKMIDQIDGYEKLELGKTYDPPVSSPIVIGSKYAVVTLASGKTVRFAGLDTLDILLIACSRIEEVEEGAVVFRQKTPLPL